MYITSLQVYYKGMCARCHFINDYTCDVTKCVTETETAPAHQHVRARCERTFVHHMLTYIAPLALCSVKKHR